MSAYGQPSAPLPPPPGTYNNNPDAISHASRTGIAPVNQVNNAFGGRAGGNPNESMGAQMMGGLGARGGNRSSQHVATPGNNNVAYASPTLLASANTLWQKGMNAPGSPGPANGMSFGFMKNDTQLRGAPAPPPPPPVTQYVPPGKQANDHLTSVTNTAAQGVVDNGQAAARAEQERRDQQAAELAAAERRRADALAAQNAAQGGTTSTGSFGAAPAPVGTVAAGTAAPSPFTTKLQADQAWDRNKMGPKTFTDSAGRVRGTDAYIAYLTRHGFR